MIRYIKHHSIDRAKYDHCVRMDETGLVYGFSWYLDSVCENWDAIVKDDYAAVWPLPVRNKFGIRYYYRPFAVQQLGIFSKSALEEHTIRQFILEMQRNCSYADIFMNENQLVAAKNFKNLKVSKNLNLTLQLNRSFREIYQMYSSNTRRNINKSAKNNLQLFERDDPKKLIGLFKENKGDRLDLSEAFYQNLEKVMYKCLHNGTGKVWTIYGPGNSVCAGTFVIETEKRHTLLFTALSDEGKELRAMHYLINEYLIYNSETQKVFDFEGSNDPGTARFYEGFGAQKVNYNGLNYNGLPLPIRWLKS